MAWMVQNEGRVPEGDNPVDGATVPIVTKVDGGGGPVGQQDLPERVHGRENQLRLVTIKSQAPHKLTGNDKVPSFNEGDIRDGNGYLHASSSPWRRRPLSGNRPGVKPRDLLFFERVRKGILTRIRSLFKGGRAPSHPDPLRTRVAREEFFHSGVVPLQRGAYWASRVSVGSTRSLWMKPNHR